ncbi:MAG: thiamine pyrophosphate-dependent enzyme, partial [Candidatus Micrarchaeota archaeon]
HMPSINDLGLQKEQLFERGQRACAGCGATVAIHLLLDAIGKDCIVVNATGCMEIVSSPYPESAWNVPYIHANFENAAAVASGISRALKTQGNNHTKVVVIAGDGSTYDIGFGVLSGMLERNEDVLYICYDNEAYMNCLSLDSLIYTKEGLKKITEVKLGDSVYAFNQQNRKLVLKKCSGVFDNGVKKVYELATLHHSIKATSNHPFLTISKQGKFVWKELSELKIGEEVVTLKELKEGSSESFTSEKVVSIKFVKEEPTLDLRVEGEHNFIADGIVVHNTGVQRSSATPLFAHTTTSKVGGKFKGKQEVKKPIFEIVIAHGIPYAASTSIAYPFDIYNKVKKALAIEGSRFIAIHAPCVPGWNYPSCKTIEMARLAVDTGMWKMLEFENGKLKITKTPAFKPLKDYLNAQKRFGHVSEQDIIQMETYIKKEFEKLQKLVEATK